MTMDVASIIELTRLTTICLGMAIGAFTVFGIAAMIRAPEQTIKLMFALVQSGSVIRLGAAVVIILVIFGLRLTDKISAEATIATLSVGARACDFQRVRAAAAHPRRRRIGTRADCGSGRTRRPVRTVPAPKDRAMMAMQMAV